MSAVPPHRGRELLGGVLAAALVAACAGTPTPSPVATPAPSVARATPGPPAPTPTPTWTDVSFEQLRAACGGTPITGAAPYAGNVHPLVVITASADDTEWPTTVGLDVNARSNSLVIRDGNAEPWPGPIQLVVCLYHDKPKQVGSCGLYEGPQGVGELIRVQNRVTLRVVVAETGKLLEKKVIARPVPKCSREVVISLSQLPPYEISSRPTEDQIDVYATALSGKAPLPVKVTKMTNPVSPGNTASVTAFTIKGADCYISVLYDFGELIDEGLGLLDRKKTDARGYVTWKWRLRPWTNPQTSFVTVRCDLGGRTGLAMAEMAVR